ncbi:hypothetical protein VTN02DRAFT_1759 [Thermoascus thermophilus]
MNRWTPELDRQLLFVLLDQSAKHDWEKVSKVMNGFTAEACRREQELEFLVLIRSIKDVKMSTDEWTTVASQMGPWAQLDQVPHFAKLKKDALAITGGANSDAGAASAPATPKRKRGANAATGEDAENEKKKPRRRGKKAEKENAAAEDAVDNADDHSAAVKGETDSD